MEEIGPVDYAVIAFPGSAFTGEIVPALTDLVDAGVIRIIDVAFAIKDADGVASACELSQLDAGVRKGLERAGIEVSRLFSDEDLAAAAEELEPGSSAALIVWENVWATRIANAVRASNGELLDFDRLPHEVVQAAREWASANTGQGG
jgi:hypothetical protein